MCNSGLFAKEHYPSFRTAYKATAAGTTAGTTTTTTKTTVITYLHVKHTKGKCESYQVDQVLLCDKTQPLVSVRG